MTTISLYANDQLLTVVFKPKIASGDMNSVLLHVDFDSIWDRFAKSAVFFTSNDDTVYEMILTDGECTVPHEVLAESGTLFVGIRGVAADNAVKTSTLVKYKIDDGAPVGDGTTVEPTPDVYKQILARLNESEFGAKVTQTEGGAVITVTDINGTTTATITNGKTPVKGIDYFDGKDGITPAVTVINGKEPDGRGNATIEVKYTVDGVTSTQSAILVDGKNGETPIKGVDYYTEADKQEFIAGLAQVEPPVIVSSVDEMTDPTKHYVLGGYIYSHRTIVIPGETTYPNLFSPAEDRLNKRLSGSTGSVSDSDGSFITDFIEVTSDFASASPYIVRLNREVTLGGQSKVVFFRTAVDTGELKRNGANILTTANTTVANGETVSDIKTLGNSTSVLPSNWSEVTHIQIQYQLSTSALTMSDIENCEVTFDSKSVTTEDTTRTEFVNSGITYPQMFDSEAIAKNTTDIAVLKEDVKELKNSGTSSGVSSGTVWYAVGDSITSGYLIGGATKTWVAHVMKYNGYDAAKSRNLGVAGIGFVREDPTNAQVVQDIVNSNDFSNVDLVTVAVGINDWQNNCAIEDVKTAMVACFDKILSDNPYCKIFFITPFNKNRGSKETNWALGYEQNGITLEDFVAGQISACTDYGIEVIDMTHNSVINRENLTRVLYDNTHPNETCHIALGRELARKITFA